MATNDTGTSAVLIPGIGASDPLVILAQAIKSAVMLGLRVSAPCHVLKWRAPVSAGAQSKPALVDVQPHFKYVRTINAPEEILDTEELIATSESYQARGNWPVIPNCPVNYAGHEGMMSRGPIKVGEAGNLVFADRSYDEWISVGGPVDPAVNHHVHDITDAVFVPGLRYGTVAKPIASDEHVVGPADGSAGMKIQDVLTPDLEVFTIGATATVDALTSIKIGAAAVAAIAKAPQLVAAIDALLLAGVNAGGPGAANFSAATTAWNPFKNSIAATKGQVE